MTNVAPQQVQVDYVQSTDRGGIILFGTALETSEAVALTIQSKKYNPETRQHEADEETYNEGLSRLQSLGATSFETAEVELNDLIISGELILPEVYISGDRVSFNPITSGFETFEKKIENKTAKVLDGVEVVTGAFSEFKGFRFNLGVDAEDETGEVKHYRVSQIILDNDDEDTYSLKYISQRIQGLRNNIRDNNVPESRIESLQNIIEKLTETERNKKVKQLTDLFKKDFEKIMEDGYRIKGKIKIGSVGSGRDKINFVTVVVDPTDFIVEPAEDETAE